MRFSVGNWVEVTIRRMDGPELVKVGKVVEATRDYAVADCGGTRFTMSDDTQGYVFFRRMTGVDWARRKRGR
jgi:hypothetical protein